MNDEFLTYCPQSPFEGLRTFKDCASVADRIFSPLNELVSLLVQEIPIRKC